LGSPGRAFIECNVCKALRKSAGLFICQFEDSSGIPAIELPAFMNQILAARASPSLVQSSYKTTSYKDGCQAKFSTGKHFLPKSLE
jgi:hypothetical protein